MLGIYLLSLIGIIGGILSIFIPLLIFTPLVIIITYTVVLKKIKEDNFF